jgi:hypothetical protein
VKKGHLTCNTRQDTGNERSGCDQRTVVPILALPPGWGVTLILTCSSEASVPSVVAGQDSFVMAGSYPQGLRLLMSSFLNEELQPLSLSSSPAHDVQRGCFANT